jgi:integrase
MAAFVTDKQELKPGLVIFRRTDVQHRRWYCRVKLPKEDRYKTVSLKTENEGTAREKAFEYDADVRFRMKHDVPVFNRPFSAIAKDYLAAQDIRAQRGEISKARPGKLRAVIEGPLQAYAGSTQVHLIGQETWDSYPGWRRENGVGRYRDKRISDSTIRFEISIFGAVINFAVAKRFIPASLNLTKPKLKTMRRDEFNREEYRKLHTVGRAWVARTNNPRSVWYRTIAYSFILIMCNTGMRPSEAKNLRWRDVRQEKDREGREIAVLFVQGKDKSRNLVAPKSVLEYLERIRAISKATRPDDRVFTTIKGAPAMTLYSGMVETLLIEAGLRDGANGVPRSTYCFRHTYATFRLSEGVDVYFLAEQMGTSVQMIEDHYGHVNTIKHADRVLMGMGGWEPVEKPETSKEAGDKVVAAAGARQRTAPRSGAMK